MNDLTTYDNFRLNPANRKYHHTPGMIFDLLKKAFNFVGDEWEGFKRVNDYVSTLPIERIEDPVAGHLPYSRDHLVDFIYEWIILGPYRDPGHPYDWEEEDKITFWKAWENYRERTKAPYTFWEDLTKWGFEGRSPEVFETNYSKELQDVLEYFELDVLPQEPPKQKYLRLAKKHHPDAGGDCGSFIQLKEYYEILCKEIAREIPA